MGLRLGELAVDLVTMAGWHPDSRPHLQLLGPLPPTAALTVDRTVLAASRKYQAHQAALDCAGEPGPFGVEWLRRLLMRLLVWGR